MTNEELIAYLKKRISEFVAESNKLIDTNGEIFSLSIEYLDGHVDAWQEIIGLLEGNVNDR